MDVETMRQAVRLADEIAKHADYLERIKGCSGEAPISASFHFYSGAANQPTHQTYHLSTAQAGRIVSAKLKRLRAELKELQA